MKLVKIAALSVGLGLIMGQAIATEKSNSAASNLSTQDKVSYAIGASIGENFKTQSIDVNAAMVAKGIEDTISGKGTPLLSKEEIESTLMDFQKDLVKKREQQFKQAGELNNKEGEQFTAEYAKKDGVKALPSGVLYKEISAGNGKAPGDSDVVTVDYEGKLVNGTVFDSSYKRGKPATFKVSQVIPGWVETLKLMQPGATWEVVIPPKQAYGTNGIGGVVGPNQTLIFKIHLIGVNDQATSVKGAKSSASADTSTKKNDSEAGATH